MDDKKKLFPTEVGDRTENPAEQGDLAPEGSETPERPQRRPQQDSDGPVPDKANVNTPDDA